MGQKLAVVVAGGAGKQGGAVVKSLLERGHEVRAVTRSTDSAKARELANAHARPRVTRRHGRAHEGA
jgi:nucleoside-diphosphate-sugar epimerase